MEGETHPTFKKLLLSVISTDGLSILGMDMLAKGIASVLYIFLTIKKK